jgi:hypothetical protein
MNRWLWLALPLCIVCVAARLEYTYLQRDTWARTGSLKGGTEEERTAAALVRGEGFSGAFGRDTGPTAHNSPGYPLLLAGVYRLFGTYESTSGRTAQQALSILLTLAAFLMIPRVGALLGLSRSAGWLAAFLLAFTSTHFCHEATGTHDQVLGVLLLLGWLAVVLPGRASGWSSARQVWLAAGLVALLALTIPSLLAVPVLLLGGDWLAAQRAQRWPIARAGLVACGVTVVALTPWTIRNYVVLGGFVPLRSNFALELACGNRPGATGLTYAAGFGQMHPFYSAEERRLRADLGELNYLRDKQRRSCAWIAAHPLPFAGLCLRRTCLFFLGGEPFWDHPSLLKKIRILFDQLLVVAGLIELIRLTWHRAGHPRVLAAVLLGAALPYAITHVELRYRLPVTWLLVLLASHLGVVLPGSLRQALQGGPAETSSLPVADSLGGRRAA